MSLVFGRSASLAPFLSASVQSVPSGLRQIFPGVVLKSSVVIDGYAPPMTSESMAKSLPKHGWTYPRATSGIGSSTQIRLAHSDVRVPSFDKYRRDSTAEARKHSSDTDVNRKTFTYLMVAGMSVPCAYGAKNIATKLVGTLSASADVLALAKIEVKLGDIPEGQNMVFKWRGKPLFVRHRTDDEIQRESQVNIANLRHQEHDKDRVQDPKWLILLGVCTHLGCVPISNAGDYGGYYCPCHGSHYDASGRIRKGPAPLNLEIPTYEFQEDLLIVG